MKNHENKSEQAFLDWLSKDIEQHPERLHSITSAERQRIAELVEGIEVDLDAPLPADHDDVS